MMLINEFAAVAVEVDHTANGPRLRIVDLLRGGRTVYLDPMNLEALVWLDAEELSAWSAPDRILNAVERAIEKESQ
jgi:hypothetical protein